VLHEPGYDEDAERGLLALLETVRAEPSTAPASAPPITSRRLARLSRFGSTISIAAAITLAIVIVASLPGGLPAKGGKPGAPAVTHIDAHGLAADRMIAALTVADDYIVRAN
jgi:hypothetical protein